MRVPSILRRERPQAGVGLARIGTALAVTSMGALALGAVAVGALATRQAAPQWEMPIEEVRSAFRALWTLCGESAGGNLAADACQTARQRGAPAVAAQLLPW